MLCVVVEFHSLFSLKPFMKSNIISRGYNLWLQCQIIIYIFDSSENNLAVQNTGC